MNTDPGARFPLKTLRKKRFKNIVGKGENAVNQHFLLFPTMFSNLFPKMFSTKIIIATFNLSSVNALNLLQSKKLSGIELTTPAVMSPTHTPLSYPGGAFRKGSIKSKYKLHKSV